MKKPKRPELHETFSLKNDEFSDKGTQKDITVASLLAECLSHGVDPSQVTVTCGPNSYYNYGLLVKVTRTERQLREAIEKYQRDMETFHEKQLEMEMKTLHNKLSKLKAEIQLKQEKKLKKSQAELRDEDVC